MRALPVLRHCERSEAIHVSASGEMDCFASLAMTLVADVTPHSRGANRARAVAVISRLRKIEGAGKTGCALHPRSRVQNCAKKTHTSIQVQRKHSGLPRAMVLRLIACSPRRPGFLATVIREKRLLLTNLTPASGCRDHTISPSATACVRLSQATRPPHPTARFVTIASRPSFG